MAAWLHKRHKDREQLARIESEVAVAKQARIKDQMLYAGYQIVRREQQGSKAIEKPFDPLDPNADKEWCLSCDGIKPSKEFGLTRDQLHWMCADCRQDYDDPDSVLSPRPVVVEQTQAVAGGAALAGAMEVWDTKMREVLEQVKDERRKLAILQQLKDDVEADLKREITSSCSEYCKLGFCRDCGDVLDEHALAGDEFVPVAAFCRDCREEALDLGAGGAAVPTERRLSILALNDRLAVLAQPVSRSAVVSIDELEEVRVRRRKRGA